MLNRFRQKNSFFSNTVALVGGNILAQLIVVLASPILTRLYSPEDFGILAVFTAILGTVVIFSALSYESAIPLPESDVIAARLVILSLALVILITILTGLLAWVFKKSIAVLVGDEMSLWMCYLLPVGVFCSGFYQTLNFWGIRKKYFSLIAITKLTQSGFLVTIQIVGASGGALFLLIGQVFGQAAGFLKLLYKSLNEIRGLISDSSLMHYRTVAIEFKNFPLIETWGRVFNTGSGHLPAILLALWFSPTAAGLFILANRVILVPMQLIGSAIANVFYSDAPQAYRDNNLGTMVKKLHSVLSGLATPPVILLAIAAPHIFSWVFGKAWAESGELVQVMILMLYTQFITSPLSQTYNIMNRQEIGVYIQALMLIVRVISIYLGAHFENLLLAITLYSSSTAICYLLLLIWVFKVTGCKVRSMLYVMIKDTLIALGVLAPLLLAMLLNVEMIMILVTSLLSLFLGAIYYLYFYKVTLKNKEQN